MDVSVITVTWNSANFITEQIASVAAGCLGLNFEQLIVDNHSTDKTAEYIRQSPTINFFPQLKNIGFGAANNLAAMQASGDFFLLLNPDMPVMPGSINKIIAWAKMHPQAGVIGVKLTTPAPVQFHSAYPRRFPQLVDQLVILLKLHHLFPKLLAKYLQVNFDSSKEQLVDSIQGSFMLIRRELYQKLGRLFDERYFIWFEDVDLCREAKRLGFEVWYVPSIECVDYGGQSFKLRKPVWKQKAFIRSQIAYFKKWGPWYAPYILLAFAPMSMALALFYSLFV